ncbi:MAG: SIMPL domain-containing protein [Pseudomonadota bacterium]
MKRMPVILLLLFGLGGAAAVLGAEEPRYHQVNLDAQAVAQVSNDTMNVSMHTWGEHREAAQLAAQINGDMEWALALARQYQAVKVSTGGYQTWPLSSKDGLSTRGWRGQQTLTLESRDSDVLSQLVGQLQQRLKLDAMNFTVSDEQRAAVENRLIDTALEAFKTRAGIVSANLKAGGYKIVTITIGTAGQQPPIMYRARVAAMATEAADAPVAVEGGESEVRVTVSGTVELELP